MKCEDYRRLYNFWLDARKSFPLVPEAELHARECPGCMAYTRAMIKIDACLEHLPEVQVPGEILESVLAIGGRRGVRGRETLFRFGRRVAPGLPPALAWILSGLLPSPAGTASRFLLVSAALALFALSVLRPGLGLDDGRTSS